MFSCMAFLNPKQAGGSESMYSLGGGAFGAPPIEKGLRERVEMNVHSPIFQGQLIEKKLD